MTQAVLITGASSGIGEALAREYARRGWRIALAARRAPALAEFRSELRRLGSPEVIALGLDVRDTAAIAPALEEADVALGGLDLVIANAGVAHMFAAGAGQIEQMREMIEVNLTGACATVDAAVAIFLRRGRGGHVVGISSMARYRGLARLGIYSATKAGLHRYLQATRMEHAGAGIAVTELSPGYIDTPMNRANTSRPFVVGADVAAHVMADLIERRVAYATVPRWPWMLLGRLT